MPSIAHEIAAQRVVYRSIIECMSSDYEAKAMQLASRAEKDQPGLAAIAYALLAASSGSGWWHKLDDYDDLPDQLEQDYIFEYPDGEHVKWRLTADNEWGMHQFVTPGKRPRVKDGNDLVDECTRWRWA